MWSGTLVCWCFCAGCRCVRSDALEIFCRKVAQVVTSRNRKSLVVSREVVSRKVVKWGGREIEVECDLIFHTIFHQLYTFITDLHAVVIVSARQHHLRPNDAQAARHQTPRNCKPSSRQYDRLMSSPQGLRSAMCGSGTGEFGYGLA